MIGVTKSEVVTTIRRNTFLAGAGKKRIRILLRRAYFQPWAAKPSANFGEIPNPTKRSALKNGLILQM
jgi:hypothetical protein